MTSAGKWVLGLLLLVVGAVFVARTVSSDPGGSAAQVKNNLPGAAVAGAAKDAKDAAAVEAAAKKKIASTIAGDLSCKKACVEVNEVAADSITTAKLAPGSVTLSKLAFEVPNLNELENEINARKAAEASVKAAQAEAAAAGAKNDAAITAAASNGITQEAAARAAADEDLAKKTAAADADLLSKLNTEVKDRGDADNVLQGKLNTEIADRAGAINNLRSELGNGNQVGAPIVQINNNEIVKDAVTTDKLLADTILAEDLATGSVTSVEILNDTVAAEDLANNAVIGRGIPADLALTNVKAGTLRGERTLNGNAAESTGDIALGTITGENNNLTPADGKATGNIGLRTVGRQNLVDSAVDGTKILDDSVAVEDLSATAVLGRGLSSIFDILTNIQERSIRGERKLDRTDSAGDIALGSIVGEDDNLEDNVISGNLGIETVGRENLVDAAVDNSKLKGDAVTSDKIANGTIVTADLSDASNDLVTPTGVTTGKIENSAITSAKVADGAIRTSDLADASNIALLPTGVTTAKLENSAVTSLKVEDGTIATVDLRDASNDLASPTGVTTAKIEDHAITTDKIANGAVRTADLADASNGGTARGVTTAKVEDGAITDAKLDPNGLRKAFADYQTALSSAAVGGPTPNNPTSLVDWTRLKGVPLDFADNIDNVDGGTASNLNCASATPTCVQDAEIEGVSGSKVTSAVANATNAANATTAATATTALTATDLGCTGRCVGAGELATDAVVGRALGGSSVSNIAAGSIRGQAPGSATSAGDIAIGTITGQGSAAPGAAISGNLAALTVGVDNLAPGAVTTAKIADKTILAEDLADGAVKTNKMTANAVGGPVGGASINLTTGNLAGSNDPASVTLTPVGTDAKEHVVQLNGQFQAALVSPAALSGTDSITVTWQLFQDNGPGTPPSPVSPLYTGLLTSSNTLVAGSVSQLLPNGPVLGPVEGSAKSYLLRVSASSTAISSPTAVTISDAVVSAIDLGQRP